MHADYLFAVTAICFASSTQSRLQQSGAGNELETNLFETDTFSQEASLFSYVQTTWPELLTSPVKEPDQTEEKIIKKIISGFANQVFSAKYSKALCALLKFSPPNLGSIKISDLACAPKDEKSEGSSQVKFPKTWRDRLDLNVFSMELMEKLEDKRLDFTAAVFNFIYHNETTKLNLAHDAIATSLLEDYKLKESQLKTYKEVIGRIALQDYAVDAVKIIKKIISGAKNSRNPPVKRSAINFDQKSEENPAKSDGQQSQSKQTSLNSSSDPVSSSKQVTKSWEQLNPDRQHAKKQSKKSKQVDKSQTQGGNSNTSSIQLESQTKQSTTGNSGVANAQTPLLSTGGDEDAGSQPNVCARALRCLFGCFRW